MRDLERALPFETLETCNYMGSEDEWDANVDSNNKVPFVHSELLKKSEGRLSIQSVHNFKDNKIFPSKDLCNTTPNRKKNALNIE